MSKIKSVIANPFLLGINGFVIGAAMLWSTADAPRGFETPAVSGPSLIAPVASAS